MNAQLSRTLRKLCTSTSSGDPVAAKTRYKRLKRGWYATPWPARHGLLLQLKKAAGAMAGMLDRAAEAGRQAAAAAKIAEKSVATSIAA